MRLAPEVPALVRACHPEPTLAVTTLTALLAIADGADPRDGSIVVLAVFTGQLVIGWSNDLLDAARDRQAGRADKPLATGVLRASVVQVALVAAGSACLVLSLLAGWPAAVTHLGLVVASGLAYNVGVKATVWSWLPYAVAFGALPSVVSLAVGSNEIAPLWMTAAGAMLGVGAHLVNALPDLDEDAHTGVHGFPHRLGARRVQQTATAILVLASVVGHFGPSGTPPWWSWVGLGVVLLLAAVGLRGQGKTPFHAAIAIALVDVLLLVLRG